MGPAEMIVAIVAIVMIAQVMKARYRAKHGIVYDKKGNERVMGSGDNDRLQEEIRTLKERVQVLERCITDQRQSSDLSLEIEKLRDR